MSRTPRSSVISRCSTIALGAVAASAVLAAPASAAFTSDKCLGDPAAGRGASFAASAHNQVFAPNFSSVFCASVGSAPSMSYESTGSGSGRRVMGARTNGSPEGDNTSGALSRSFAPRYGMSEEPLSSVDQVNVNKGTDAVGDEGIIRTIPLALGSVAIVVNIPDGCSITQQADGSALTSGQQASLSDPTSANTRRLQLTRSQIELIFNGGTEIDTWGELVAWINDGNSTPSEASDTRCANFPLVRIRRLDDGGTTFVLKDYLNQLNPGRGWLSTYTTPDTRTWPNHDRTVSFDYNNDGDTTDAIASCAAQFAPFNATTCTEGSVPLLQTTEVPPSAGNGNDDLVNKVNDFDGAIGYGDLSTARQQRSFAFERQANATDDKYWVKVQAKNLTSYADPQSAPTGFVTSGARGSSCNTATLRNLPGGADPTTGDWSQASATDSTQAGYGICSLTYALAFDDYSGPYSAQADQAAEERKARSVRDYLEAATTSGQTGLVSFDYAPLSPDLQTLASNAAKQIGWAKTGGGGGGGGTTTPPTGGGGGGSTPIATPTAPSNAFTLGKVTNSKGAAKFTLQLPGAGAVKVRVLATVGSKKNREVAVVSRAGAAGPLAFTVKLNSTGRKELKKKKKLAVVVEVTFTPTGGSAKTLTKKVTLK